MIAENTTKDRNEEYVLQSVANALRIMGPLGERNFLTLAEIAGGLDLGKSSIFRLAATLEIRGFAKKDKHGRHRFGVKFSCFSSVVLVRMKILQASCLYLEEFQRNVHEAAHLVTWDDGWNIRFINKIDGGIALRMKSFVGPSRTYYSTTTGRSVLAFMGGEFIHNFLENAQLTPMTPYTTTEPEKLLESLEEIRHSGYCLSIEEDEPGLTRIGASIANTNQKPIIVINIFGPTVRITEYLSEYPKRVVGAAKLISKSIS